MFARYTINGTGTVANILSDVVAICTGQTDKTLLSAACDQANTYIISSVGNEAGWTVHDPAAGTNKQVIKAPNADTSTKYVLLDFSFFSGSTYNAYVNLYETWDNGTPHSGTNPAFTAWSAYSASYPALAITTAGSSLLISASNRRLVIWSRTAAGVYTLNGPFVVAERERIDPWDTFSAGYPVGIMGYSDLILAYPSSDNYGFQSPRAKGASGDILKPYYNVNTAANDGSANGYVQQAQIAKDANFNTVHPMLPMYLRGNTTAFGYLHLGGKVSGDMYVTTYNNGALGDEITYNGKQYMVMGSSASGSYPNSRLAVPKY
jgi:hypothetical protein